KKHPTAWRGSDMLRPTVRWTWLGAIVFFFAWGFVIHSAGLLLHEVGGHGGAGIILGCPVDRFDLTYFGGGVTYYYYHRDRCHSTFTLAMRGWAGIAVTISAGAIAMAFQRRAGLTPLTRLLLALVATQLTLGNLAYATSGGFREDGDPGLTAHLLASHG